MIVTLHWWMIPVLLIIIGHVAGQAYINKKYKSGGYFPDVVTPLVGGVIFLLFIFLSVGICIGRWLL